MHIIAIHLSDTTLGEVPDYVEAMLTENGFDSVCAEAEAGRYYAIAPPHVVEGPYVAFEENIRKYHILPVWIGYSPPKSRPADLWEACHEAAEAQSSGVYDIVVRSTDRRERLPAASSRDLERLNRLEADARAATFDIERGSMNRARESIPEIVAALDSVRSRRNHRLAGRYTELLAGIWDSFAIHLRSKSSRAPQHLQGCPLWLGGSADELCSSMMEAVERAAANAESGLVQRNALVRDAVAFARTNCMTVTLDAAARHVGVSSVHLSRLVKQVTGRSFVEVVVSMRVLLAQSLLADPKLKIYEVSDYVGYSDAKYFAQVFRRHTGLTPSEYRRAGAPSRTRPVSATSTSRET